MSYKDDLAVKIATYTGEQMVALAYEAMIENLEDAKKAIKNKDLDCLRSEKAKAEQKLRYYWHREKFLNARYRS